MGINAALRAAMIVASCSMLACTGGARLRVQIEDLDAAADADADADAADAETTGETDATGDAAQADTVDTASQRSCLEDDIECGPNAYCSYPDGRCSAPVADCSEGWCVLPAAAFMMGDDGYRGPPEELEQLPRHPVILSHQIRMMATNVRVLDWEPLMGPLTNPLFPSCGEDCPATGGTTTAKLAYANAASERDGLEPCYGLEGCTGTGDQIVCDDVTYKGLLCRGYRLPTEAESEFAARAAEDYCFDPDAPGIAGDRDAWLTCSFIPELADSEWYCANSDVDYPGGHRCRDSDSSRRCGYHPVGEKRANAFGLYDTLGNTDELTTTLWSDDAAGLEIDPGHPTSIPNDLPLVQHISDIWDWPIGCCPTVRDRMYVLADVSGFEGFRLVQTIFDDRGR